LIVSVIVILIFLVLARLKQSETMEQFEYASTLGIITSLLASPISWTGYTILLLPIFFSLRKWTLPVIMAAAILTIPFQVVLQLFQTSFTNFVIFGWLYGWAILLLLGDLVSKTLLTTKMRMS
jgi:hypothetical protein